MKVILGQIILNYDLELVDLDAPRWFTWLLDYATDGEDYSCFHPTLIESGL